ncbi:MAG TPA: UDP-N-acetylmuramoyl-L-alanyl-D-glutamate--2,6-diaminopimelate ligase [Terriglobales bacterium]|nr:UDP-N-acetylmuramoyl-L-alanyl-D-glutamate--2,6-diaminopimelate ligase [Terriglobales bacterium]
MQLVQLFRDQTVLARRPALPDSVAGLHYDSRRIQPGWAFFAIRGEVSDGNAFIAQARARGATLIVSDQASTEADIRVPNARVALAQASANWFGRPAEKLRLVGITGTNGKTTTAFLVEAMMRAAGLTTGLVGTIEYHIGERVLPSPHTTPESYDLQALLAQMVESGCGAAVMEVSSHALAMERVWSCPFEVGVFTNLTQDHLDFHGSMENYRAAKHRLFTGLGAPPPPQAVVNADDPAAQTMLEGYQGVVRRFGFSSAADLRASEAEYLPVGSRFAVNGQSFATPLLGRVNVLNTLAALGVARALGIDEAAQRRGMAALTRVPGRFERVFRGQPFMVAVDYAHTPDALAHLLALARELAPRPARVLVVFGCGGDRDRGKRPLMGRAAAQAADWVMVTSDNPRSEKPEAIIAEILSGSPEALHDPDRHAAIRLAVAEARPGDIVIIAGKGHEHYQIIGDQRIDFDDAAEAGAALAELGWKE